MKKMEKAACLLASALLSVTTLTACGSLADKALAAIGIKEHGAQPPQDQPSVPDSAIPDWRVSLRLHASESLNADEQGQPLALLVRVYRLKSPDAFLRAPYESFGDPLKEKAALNEDLVSVRELQLLPGQRHASLEKIAPEARYIGVVGLYRHPLADRWRHAFATPEAALSGLRLGALACAISVQVGRPIGDAGRRTGTTSAPCPDQAPAPAP